MANKTKQALARTRQRDQKARRASQSQPTAKRAAPEPRSRPVPTGTNRVELKARTYQEIAQHFRRSSHPVTWNTDEPDVD